jgi:predicted DNA binding CopG/RHH family protein
LGTRGLDCCSQLAASQARSAANLQPSTTAISLRLPVSLLEEIKIAAHKRDVPYQSLIKIWLSEKVG